MPTLLEWEQPDTCAKLCSALGLQFIELNMDLPPYIPSLLPVEQLRRLAERYRLYYTLHLGESCDPCDFNPQISQACLQTALTAIEVAKALQAPIINFHLAQGVYFTFPERRVYLYNQYFDQYLLRLRTFRDICSQAIGAAPLKMCIENALWAGHSFLLQGIELLLESEHFALTFDVGHNYIQDGSDDPVILRHLNRLCHMHLHDATGKREYLPLGDGQLDIAGYLALAQQCNCRVVLEAKSNQTLQRSVEWLRFHRLLGEPATPEATY